MGRFVPADPTAPAVGGKGFFGPSTPVIPPQVWTARTGVPFGPILNAAAGNGTAVVGSNGTPHWSKNVGATWTASNTFNVVATSPSDGGFFQNGSWIIAGGNSTHVNVARSTDGGKNFALTTLVAAANPGISLLGGNGSRLILGLSAALAGGNYFTSDDDGATWTQRNTTTFASWGNSSTQNTIIWDGTQFVALVQLPITGHTALVTSSDAITWSIKRDFGTGFIGSIAFCPGAVGGPFPFYLMAFGTPKVAIGVFTLDDLLTGANGSYDSGGRDVGFSGIAICTLGLLSHPGTGVAGAVAFSRAGEVVAFFDGPNFRSETLNFAAGDICQTAVQDFAGQQIFAFAGGLGSSVDLNSCSTRPDFVSF